MKNSYIQIRRAAYVAAVFFLTSTGAALAAPPAGTAYFTDPQSSFVEDATSQGIGTVNMIACFMSSMRPDALVNQGNYVALVDEMKCDSNRRSAGPSSGGSGGDQAPQYTRAIVNAARASNSDPMVTRVWIASEMGSGDGTIFVRTTATEAPSAGNAYGVFRLDFCGKGIGQAASAPCGMFGYVDANALGLQFFQNEADGTFSMVTQLTLTQGSGGDSGGGRLAIQENDNGVVQNDTFAFAYNATHYLRNDSITNQNVCFSRRESDAKKSVWRYGLYDNNGARVERNSGFPVTWTNSVNNTTYQGHMGYYGLWMQDDQTDNIPNGATLTKQAFGEGAVGQSYTLFKARGRLVKYTRQTKKLDRINNVRIMASVFESSQWQQIEMYWNGTQFVKSGQFQCSGGSCGVVPVNPVQAIANSSWASTGGIFGWSQSLGGEVFIGDVGNLSMPSVVDVVYRVQSLVYPNEIPASLKCIGECPTLTDMTNYFTDQVGATSPFAAATVGKAFDPSGVAAGALVSYEQDGSTGELRVAGGANAIVITNASWLTTKPHYVHGLRTGKLFDATDMSAVLCTGSTTNYCGSKLNDLPSYYVWETGVKQWNQFFALRAPAGNCTGSTDAFCRFDAPLSVTFSVPNDVNTYGDYAGRDVVLQYGGFGNLWGIPGNCVNRFTNELAACANGNTTRYVPAFAIPFDAAAGVVTSGSTTYYVRWLDREVRFATVASGQCASLSLPAGLTLPTAGGFLNPGTDSSANYVGVQPSLTSAPRVIHGEVKY